MVNSYASSNDKLYDEHTSTDNVVTKSTLFDILIKRAASYNDQDAWLFALKLVRHYRHRTLKHLNSKDSLALPDVVFLNALCIQASQIKE